ncbi:type VII secretion-associated serine protease mycosin [Streptomyces sp. OZ13]|uniref:type VII secretion-associated serine protease mycosin n=1 Tax=Streptomyces sp. OZ13 TaxID=3452210 RepID=UPI003F8AE5F6
MNTSSRQQLRLGRALSATLGLLLVGIAATPAHADSLRSKQWHLDAMNADEMWKTSTGEGVTVAVIDTGVDPSLPDLRGQVLEGRDFSPESGTYADDVDGHGTGMAALIAGTGKGGGSYGLAPGAKILPIRLWKEDGEQMGMDAERAEAAAIRYAADSSAKVINISLGGVMQSEVVEEAVQYALGKNKLIFAAAGNSGTSFVEYPAAVPGVVAVGSVDKKVNKTAESATGPEVDLVAPGVDIVSACKEAGPGRYCVSSGTSDATALASASAALIWSKYPEWTNNQVLRVMLNTAGGPRSGNKRNDSIGYGVVRPRIALKSPGDPGPANEYPLPDLAEAASPSSAPSPDASEPAAGSEDSKEQPAVAAPASEDESNSGLWIGLGVAAALLLGAAIGIPVVRARRG